jgi:Trypsin
MRRILTTLAVVVGVVLTGGATAQAITGNFSPDLRHAYVGLMAVYDKDGEFLGRCSGTLLTDRVFLTAGHCVVDDALNPVASARIWFEQDAGADYDPVTDTPATSGYPYTGGVTAHRFFSYGYPGTGIPETKDVALVVLDKSVTTVYKSIKTYGSLASAGTLDRYVAANKTGKTATVTLSGYGLTYSNGNPDKTISYRSRLETTAAITGLGSNNTKGYNVQLSTSPGGDGGGSCFGDSGGPIFVGDTNVVSAVVSFGMSKNVCGGTEYDYRTDQKAVIDWILAQAATVGEQGEIRVV